MKFVLSTLLALTLTLVAAGASRADEDAEIFSSYGSLDLLGDTPHYLDLAIGEFNNFDGNDQSVAGQVEFRYGGKLGFVGPTAGVMANTDGGVLGYGGIYLDMAVGDFVITPLWGAAAWEEGDSRDLGGVFQFLSQLTVARRFENDSLLGIRYGHISNADLHDSNPGADNLFLTFSIPFR